MARFRLYTISLAMTIIGGMTLSLTLLSINVKENEVKYKNINKNGEIENCIEREMVKI